MATASRVGSSDAGAPEWIRNSDCKCPVCQRLDRLAHQAFERGSEFCGLTVSGDVWRGPIDRIPDRPNSRKSENIGTDDGVEVRPSGPLNEKATVPEPDKRNPKVVDSRTTIIDDKSSARAWEPERMIVSGSSSHSGHIDE